RQAQAARHDFGEAVPAIAGSAYHRGGGGAGLPGRVLERPFLAGRDAARHRRAPRGGGPGGVPRWRAAQAHAGHGRRAGGRLAVAVPRLRGGRDGEVVELREAVGHPDRAMKPETPPALDTSFRAALARMRAAGRLRTLGREADPDLEIASIMKKLDGAHALVFPSVRGHGVPVIGNLLGSQANCEAAFGAGFREIRGFVARGLGNPIPPERVSQAPCQARVHRQGFDIGKMFPVLRHTEADSGRFITAGIAIVQDPETGVYNASYHRLQLLGPNRTAVKLDYGRHLRAAFERAQRMKKDLPVAFVLGTDLAVQYTAATMGAQMPESADELAVAGGVRGSPL